MDIWEPNPEKPGYLRFVRMKTVQEVFDELKARLEAENLVPDEYFHADIEHRYNNNTPEEMPIPSEFWRVACFAVKGGSEGYYFHIGVILKDGKYQDLFIGKTLREGENGINYANQVIGACTKAFHS